MSNEIDIKQRLVEAIDDLYEAGTLIDSIFWELEQEIGDDVHDFFSPGFPFSHSFDEIVYDILLWRDTLQQILDGEIVVFRENSENTTPSEHVRENRELKKSYTVRTYLDNELKDFITTHNIHAKVVGPYITFIGTIKDLEKLHNKFFYEYTFDLERPEHDPFKENTTPSETIKKLAIGVDKEQPFRLLSRLLQDIKYFLGNGNGYEGHLWSNNREQHILDTQYLYDKLISEYKEIEWINQEQLDDYFKQMREKEVKPSRFESKKLKENSSNSIKELFDRVLSLLEPHVGKYQLPQVTRFVDWGSRGALLKFLLLPDIDSKKVKELENLVREEVIKTHPTAVIDSYDEGSYYKGRTIISVNLLGNTLKENTSKDLTKQIKDLVDPFLDSEGRIEIDRHYDDYMEAHQIQEVLDEDNPRDYYTDLIDDIWTDHSWDYLNDILNTAQESVLKDLENQGVEITDDVWEQVNEYLNEVGFTYPNYAGDKFDAFIIVSTPEERNHDYTLIPNSHYSNQGYENLVDEEIENIKNSILGDLIESQGYSIKEVANTLFGEPDNDLLNDSLFVNTLYHEVLNNTSGMSALTLLGSLTLEDAFDLKEGKATLTLEPGDTIGFFDGWSGSGSIFEIVLEKPFKIKPEYLDYIGAAHAKGKWIYSPQDVYGFVSSIYRNDVSISSGEVKDNE